MFNFTDKAAQALEGAASLASSANHIEPEHLGKVLMSDEIMNYLIEDKKYQINDYIEKQIESFPKIQNKAQNQAQNEGIPTPSARCASMLQNAMRKSQDYKDEYISVEWLSYAFLATLPKSFNINISEIEQKITDLREGKRVTTSNYETKQRVLEKYTIDITAKARENVLDPVIGRDNEIRRLVEIIGRRGKNNPVLVGEAGVGKTAIVEGLAQCIVNGNVNERLKGTKILSLEMARLLAGTKYRGDFEDRLTELINEISIRNKKEDASSQIQGSYNGGIILFIDEIHTLVGAGKTDGAMDAANILKPALARGQLMCIGATTENEYKKYIEKDSALERRFLPVTVKEPSVAEAITILRGVKHKYDLHHGVFITDKAIEAAVKLSDRYITERRLPDKALDLIDEAASMIRTAMDSEPEALSIKKGDLYNMQMELNALSSEPDRDEPRIADLQERIEKLKVDISLLQKEWQQGKEQIAGLRALQKTLEEENIKLDRMRREGILDEAAKILHQKIPQLNNEIEKKQTSMNSRFIEEKVTPKDIAIVLEKWVGISSEKLLEGDELVKFKNMESSLNAKVVGQQEAIAAVTKVVKRAKAGLSMVSKPIGSFLCAGPTGVGKTELAKVLADFLFNDRGSFIRIDCSEYMELHNVSRLIGSPPGYIGYEEGGTLTEYVRKNQFCVVLIDEVEKAHPKVFDLFLQILDAGRLTDGHGKTVNFKQTLILMTSNIGSEYLLNARVVDEKVKNQVMDDMKKLFRPEFLNRLDQILFFNKLTHKVVKDIVKLRFADIQARAHEEGYNLGLEEGAINYFVEHGYSSEYGARPLIRLMENTVIDVLTDYIFDRKIKKGDSLLVDYIDNKIQLQVVKSFDGA